jgi:hypothetical protein
VCLRPRTVFGKAAIALQEIIVLRYTIVSCHCLKTIQHHWDNFRHPQKSHRAVVGNGCVRLPKAIKRHASEIHPEDAKHCVLGMNYIGPDPEGVNE